MRKTQCASLAAAFILFALHADADAKDAEWLDFRGPQGSSSALGNLPTTWNVESGENIAWQVNLPGRGVSGPIVVGDRVIVTASSGPKRDRLHVLALDANTGERAWHRQFWATGRTLCHETSANAAPTPASDGQRIYAFFSSNDLICLDLDGNMQWMRGLALDHPGLGNDIGMSASPAVAGGNVIVQCECQRSAFAAAYDGTTGEELWTVNRPNASNWCSPIAIDVEMQEGAQPAVVLQSEEGVTAHLASNGKELWTVAADCESIPSPSESGGVLYVPGSGITAIDTALDASSERRIWNKSSLKPGSPSPVLVDKQLLLINSGGVLTSASMEDGSVNWKKRLGGRFWATPVAAGGHLYAINNSGDAYVVDLANGKIVSENSFGDEQQVLGSPAVANDAFFVRSHEFLWKIAGE